MSLGITDKLLYNWKAKFEAEQLHLYQRAKATFTQSRNSLGYQELRKRLCKESLQVSNYGVQKLMAKLSLVVTQHVAYKVTAKRKHSDVVVDNLLNQNFNNVFNYTN